MTEKFDVLGFWFATDDDKWDTHGHPKKEGDPWTYRAFSNWEVHDNITFKMKAEFVADPEQAKRLTKKKTFRAHWIFSGTLPNFCRILVVDADIAGFMVLNSR